MIRSELISSNSEEYRSLGLPIPEKMGFDPFVPKDSEESYLGSHGIEFRLLPNGTLVAGGLRKVEDVLKAGIEIEFPTGMYFDPLGKRHASHTLEHLFAQRPVQIGKKNHADYVNATTAPDLVSFTLAGTANPDFRQYGIWPVIPAIFQEFRALPFTQADFNRERDIILREVELRLGDPTMAVRTEINEFVFGPDNPILYQSRAGLNDVKALELEDSIEASRRVINSQDMVVRAFVNGNAKAFSELMSRLSSEAADVQNRGFHPKQFDPDLYNQLNPEFDPEIVYRIDNGSRSGLVSITHLSILDLPRFSRERIAFDILEPTIEAVIQEKIRSLGVSYDPQLFSQAHGDKVYLNVSYRTGNEANIADLASRLMEQIVKENLISLFGDTVAEVLDTNKMRDEANPITVEDRFNHAINSFSAFGRIVDADRLKQVRLSLGQEELERALEIVGSSSFTTFAAGNLV